MPELPEVETVKNGLAPTMEGREITDVQVNFPTLRYSIPDLSILKNKQITHLYRRAKYLLVHFKDAPTLVIHLGMSGSMLVCDKTHLPAKHDHVIFTLNNGKQVRYNDPRRFGSMLLYDDLEELEKGLGLEPLSDDFNGAYLYTSAKSKPNLPLKSLLMENKIVVGIGNIYACESLFKAGLSPLKKSKTLTKTQAEKLVNVIKEVLQLAIKSGGSSLKDFKHSDGKLGYFQHNFQAYGREKQPCMQCGIPIKKVVIAQRSTFYCPQCQK